VGEATDGLEAITEAMQMQPDVILMDAQMPRLSGAEATRRIKDRLPKTKVLFLTVHEAYIDDALAAGADAHLMKDVDRRELVETIRRLGTKRHA
jgi:two-component system response regulator DegU